MSQETNKNKPSKDAKYFDEDISSWDVSNVTNIECMFSNASAFQSDRSSCGVGSVKNMEFMSGVVWLFDKDYIKNWVLSSIKDPNHQKSLH